MATTLRRAPSCGLRLCAARDVFRSSGYGSTFDRPAHGLRGVQCGSTACRIFVVSDIHTDYAENMRWAESIDPVDHR